MRLKDAPMGSLLVSSRNNRAASELNRYPAPRRRRLADACGAGSTRRCATEPNRHREAAARKCAGLASYGGVPRGAVYYSDEFDRPAGVTEPRLLAARYMQVGLLHLASRSGRSQRLAAFRCVSARPAKFGFSVKML